MEKIFEGAISCKALLEAGTRNCIKLYIDKKKNTKDTRYLVSLAKNKSCEVIFCSREQINDMATGKTHGGILLLAEEKVIPQLTDIKAHGFLCYIDGVEDPYNLGSISRTLYASGCDAMILPKRDWSFAEQTILKASAGAYEKLPMYFVDSDEELVDYCAKNQLPILCAHRKDAVGLYDYSFESDFCLCLGGALRGLSSTITSASKQNIVVEYGRDFRNALDSASAAAVFSFEILRQEKKKKF